MTEICEGSLIFSFSAACDVIKYDAWPFYCERFQSICNTKAVDILCVTNDVAWLIEVKDYRRHSRSKDDTIEDETAQKVRDTLAGLAAANANGNVDERHLASKALNKCQWRVVLHIEQADDLAYNISSTQIMLQRRLEAVDSRVVVANSKYPYPQVPWTVRLNTTETT